MSRGRTSSNFSSDRSDASRADHGKSRPQRDRRDAIPKVGAEKVERMRGTRIAAAVILAVEALCLAGVATLLLVRATGASDLPQAAVSLGVFVLIFAAAAAFAARSVLARTRFGIGYGITWQLFQALVSANMLSSSLMVYGIVGLALAIAAFILLTRLVQDRAREEMERA